MFTQERPTQPASESVLGSDQLLLKRPIIIKAIVTPLWKQEAQQQLQSQSNQLDEQLAQLDIQVEQMVGELSQQTVQLLGVDGSTIAETQSQIQDIQIQAGDRKSELLDQKSQVLAQLSQVRSLELGQEVEQGQVDSFFYAKVGDHLIRKLQGEILLRDGVIEEIRGDL
ncbi:MAG: hypothetical protein HC768_14415 [Acaryochloris sp. CRU_2_0]|nr:hypothetical protein [Acaryochloris sp. CRU_2_0]